MSDIDTPYDATPTDDCDGAEAEGCDPCPDCDCDLGGFGPECDCDDRDCWCHNPDSFV